MASEVTMVGFHLSADKFYIGDEDEYIYYDGKKLDIKGIIND